MVRQRSASKLLAVFAVLAVLLGLSFVARGAYADEPMQPEEGNPNASPTLGTQNGDDPIFVWVGSTLVTESNKDDVLGDGAVTYNVQSQTLTLNNATIEGSHEFYSSVYGYVNAGIFCGNEGDFTIELKGNNTIASTEVGIGTGFHSEGNNANTLVIKGNGSLTATGMTVEGIHVWPGNIKTEGGTLNVSATGNARYGICAHSGTVTVAGGNVTTSGPGGGIVGFEGVSFTGGKTTAWSAVQGTIKPLHSDPNAKITVSSDLEITTPKNGYVSDDGKQIVDPTSGQHHEASGEVVIEPKKERIITIAETTGGSVTTQPSGMAYRGDEVTVSVTSGELKALYVVDASGKNVAVSENKFTMPADNVTVYAWFNNPTVTVDFGEGHEDFVTKHYGNTDGFTVNGNKVTYTVEAGQTLADARGVILNKGGDFPYDIAPADRIDNGEYFREENFALKTLDQYEDQFELAEDLAKYNNQFVSPNGTTFYALWEQPAGSVETTVEALLCGTNVKVDNPLANTPTLCSDPTVTVTLADNSKAKLDSPYFNNWLTTSDGSVSAFTAAGGTSYYASFLLKATFGFYFNTPSENVTVTNSSNTTVTNYEDATVTSCAKSVRVVAAVPAEHNWEWQRTKEPTCEGKGTETATCEGCALDEPATTTREVDALGHDWKDPTYVWADNNSSVTATRVCQRDSSHKETETAKTTSTVTKEATSDEPGERTYTAVFENNAFETQTKTVDIPIKIEYRCVDGDGSTWTKGSDTGLTFVIKRATDDDTTFSHFGYIAFDGQKLSDERYYKAKPGSVVISVEPAYLETLSVGDHTLTAEFDDGSASAAFTIKAQSETESESSGGTGNTSGTSGASGTSNTSGTNNASGTSGSKGSNGTTTASTTTRTSSTTATPKTGDPSNMAPIALLIAASASCAVASKRMKRTHL